MLDGLPLVDVHLHPAHRATVKPPWDMWAGPFGSIDEFYAPDGTIDPAGFDAYLESEGVDKALVLAEYSPKVTGTQPIEDLLPLAAFERIGIIGNLNPHLHYPVDEEWQRQIGLGAFVEGLV